MQVNSNNSVGGTYNTGSSYVSTQETEVYYDPQNFDPKTASFTDLFLLISFYIKNPTSDKTAIDKFHQNVQDFWTHNPDLLKAVTEIVKQNTQKGAGGEIW
jgi:hypothetical protein